MVEVTRSPWWFVAYFACCAGMLACGIWADGDPAWLTRVLIPLGAGFFLGALILAKKIFRD